jgi:hypothetical protein
MKPVVGSKKQEAKISELGSLADRMFPDIGMMSLKGSFRHGIREALKNARFESWEKVSAQPPEIRRKFFQNVLDASVPHLKKIGLRDDEAESLIRKLGKENERYLHDF